MRLSSKIIATVGHSPLRFGEIVRRCGSKHLRRPERIGVVKHELGLLIRAGLIARLSGSRFVASDGV